MATIKKIIIIVLILLGFIIICKQIYNKNITKTEIKKESKITTLKKSTELLGVLIIPKIELKQPLYKQDSNHNNIEENVTILPKSKMPDQKDSIIFLAAHSGTGNKAYFNNLNKLGPKDKIILIFKKQQIIYEVKNIWEENKTGYIHVNKEINNQLILTTCSPNNSKKQLIINSIKKET